MAKKFERTGENLKFLEHLGKTLGDKQLRSFGLYVKLYKEFRRKGLEEALLISSEKPVEYRLKYFLGILSKEREDRRLRRRVRRSPEVKPGDSAMEQYVKLRAKLVKQMTPKYERISRTRSRLHMKLAKEERKLRRSRKAL